MTNCSIHNCGRPIRHRGWCNAHYQRWQRYGDPLGGRKTMDGEPQRYFREVVLAYDGDECLIWPFAKLNGYGLMGRDGQMQIVSRLVCEDVNGPPPTPKHEAAHACGNRPCCNRHHLSWKTRAENQADRIIHGTDSRGMKSPKAKLTEDAVLAIYAAQRGIASRRVMAKQYGVSENAIHNIHRGRTWAWLTANEGRKP